MKLVQKELDDLVHLGRDHANAALDVQTKDKPIHNNTAEIGTQHTEHHRFGIVAEGGGQGDGDTCHGSRLANLHTQVFVHDLGNDIQAAGGGIVGEQDGHGQSHHEDVAKHIQKRICGERLKIGKQFFKNAKTDGDKKGDIHRFCTELGSDQNKSQNEKEHIQKQG